MIDADGSKLQPGDRLLERFQIFLILESSRMHDQRNVERAPQCFVGELHGTFQKFGHIGCRERGFSEQTAKRFGGEADFFAVAGIKICRQQPFML